MSDIDTQELLDFKVAKFDIMPTDQLFDYCFNMYHFYKDAERRMAGNTKSLHHDYALARMILEKRLFSHPTQRVFTERDKL
jgi:hypothetical protein